MTRAEAEAKNWVFRIHSRGASIRPEVRQCGLLARATKRWSRGRHIALTITMEADGRADIAPTASDDMFDPETSAAMDEAYERAGEDAINNLLPHIAAYEAGRKLT